MPGQRCLTLLDLHAGGDVSRIVTGGIAPLPGASVRAQMTALRDQGDGLRQLLLNEPYGVPEMSVNLLVPASDPAAACGYIIMEVMGYPIYSGSNTLCTATALFEAGLIEKREGEHHFQLESPAGLVAITAMVRDGAVEAITCAGLPSYLASDAATIAVPGVGDVKYQVAYSGGFYALVDATALGFALVREEETALAACAGRIVEAIRAERRFTHYQLGDVGPLPFLHFMGPVAQTGDGLYQSRSATYVHPGVICRSTTGTGTSARLALLVAAGELGPGDRLETVSLRNTRFVGTVTGVRSEGNLQVVDNTISGRAWLLGRTEVVVNDDDPLVDVSALPVLL